MTVGEKIQLYRKRANLSQEDLAQLIIVSRQTISLWENDQTLPTIDNLIRLHDIFSVSIDEILCGDVEDNAPPAICATSAEKYSEPKKRSIFRMRRIMMISASALIIVLLIGVIVLAVISTSTPKPLVDVERAIGVSLPDCSAITLPREKETVDDSYVYYVAEIYFSPENLSAVLDALADSTAHDAWLSPTSAANVLSVIPDFVLFSGKDMLLLYDVKTGEYNTVDTEGSTYVAVAYLADEGMLTVAKFKNN